MGAACAIALCLCVFAGDARADVDGVLTFDGISVISTDPDRLTDARGMGASMRVFGTSEPFNITMGGFAAIGTKDDTRQMRDVYNIDINLGLNPPTKKRRIAVPYVSVGVNFLYVATRSPEGTSAAGMTMGMNAQGGLFGYLTKEWIYSAGVKYIGAVVPGTGEGLDGVIFHVGVGKKLFD